MNISDYENKSKEDLIETISEPKPETPKTPNPETPKTSKTPKPETPKTPKTSKREVKVNTKKLKELRKDFDELRYMFSKNEIDRYRKAFYVAKNKKHLSKSEVKDTSKSFIKLKKKLILKKFCGDVNSVYYEDLDDYDYDNDYDDDKYKTIGSIRTLFKKFNRDYYKPTRIDAGFDGRDDNYGEYKSKGDRFENLSPKKYLNLIRPYLRDLINEHKPIAELNDNDNNDNNSSNNNNNNNNSNSNNNSNNNDNNNNNKK